jgi:hypothetical protein
MSGSGLSRESKLAMTIAGSSLIGGGGDRYIVPHGEKEIGEVFRCSWLISPEENINSLPYLVEDGMLYYFASYVGGSQVMIQQSIESWIITARSDERGGERDGSW